ncbi:MAG: DNA-binding protein WhiA [Clostridiales bacterium]|nr:DNA-binding protein WhiA [Clostridiales bacterium]
MSAANISGAEVKRELTERRVKGDARLAVLSGFVRTCMSFYKRGQTVYLWLDCQSDIVRDYIASLMMEQFKITPSSNVIDDGDKLVFADAARLLRELNITEEGGSLFEPTPIAKKFYDDARHYARGVFLGSGSLSVPSALKADQHKASGYHLEFSLSTELFANEFIGMLSAFNIYAHLTIRAGKYIVYVKHNSDVSDCLALMGAEKTVLRLNEAVVAYEVKNSVNRQINCDMANLSRTVEASVAVVKAIDKLERVGALDRLGKKIIDAANARKQNRNAPLGVLAKELGISKSALKHRFDVIIEEANKIE